MNSFDILRRPIISERSMETVLDREGNEIRDIPLKFQRL